MPTLDIFNNDAFSLSNLTRAINEAPFQPMLLGSMGLFSEEGINTTSLMIEKRGTTLALIPATPRGDVRGRVESNDKGRLYPIQTTHLPQSGSVLADEVQGVRAFGTENELETVQNLVNRKLAKMRRNIDVTIEWQRIGAIKGQILDSDASTVLLDLYTTFGVSQQTQAMALNNDATKVKLNVLAATRKVEDKLGGVAYSGLVAICGKTFFDSYTTHPAVEAAFARWMDAAGQQGAFLRDSQRSQQAGRPGFNHCGVNWVEYRGGVGNVTFIGDDDAYLVPLGIADLFTTTFAPADYMETVNTIGLPYYAKQEAMRMNKGVELEAQSNPISICTRPDVIVKMTKV